MSEFKGGLTNLEITLTEVEKYVNDVSPYSLNDLLDHLNNNSKRKMIVVVISDITGLNNLDERVLKKITHNHDMLFVNIEDASICGEDIFDIEEDSDIPRFISKNINLKQVETKERRRIITNSFNRLKKYRITGVSISNKREIVDKLINLLERHNHAVGR